MEAIVFIILHIFFTTHAVLKIGEYSRIFPSFSWGIFGHVTCLDQSRASENIWWIISYDIFPRTLSTTRSEQFPRVKLYENCELQGTGKLQGQISEHILNAKWRLLRWSSFKYFSLNTPDLKIGKHHLNILNIQSRDGLRPISCERQYLMDYNARYSFKLYLLFAGREVRIVKNLWPQLQFFSLHEWVFQKAEIARAASASAISAFWKTYKCKLIPNWTRKTVWLLIHNINMKKVALRKCRKIILEAIFFSFEKTFFKVTAQNFRHHFSWYHFLRKSPIIFQPIIIQNYIVQFSLVLHLNCTALSQSESSNFFSYIYTVTSRVAILNLSLMTLLTTPVGKSFIPWTHTLIMNGCPAKLISFHTYVNLIRVFFSTLYNFLMKDQRDNHRQWRVQLIALAR